MMPILDMSVMSEIAIMRRVELINQREVNSYVTQGTFLIEQQVAFRKMKKQHVVCGPIGRQAKTMEVELLTWCQQMVRQC